MVWKYWFGKKNHEVIFGKSNIYNIRFPPQIDGHENIEGDQRWRTVDVEI